MNVPRVKGLLKMSPWATPRAALIADIRRVVQETGRLTVTAYLAEGDYCYKTINNHFGSWPHALECAGLGAAYRKSRAKATARTIAITRRTRTKLLALAEQRELRANMNRPRTQRACLRCAQPFDSTGPGNRLCRTCLHKIELMGPTMEDPA